MNICVQDAAVCGSLPLHMELFKQCSCKLDSIPWMRVVSRKSLESEVRCEDEDGYLTSKIIFITSLSLGRRASGKFTRATFCNQKRLNAIVRRSSCNNMTSRWGVKAGCNIRHLKSCCRLHCRYKDNCCCLFHHVKVKVKVKFSLEQATKAQRGNGCIALLFPQSRHQLGVGGRHAPAALPPGKTRYPFTGGWVGPRAGLDGCGKSRPCRVSISPTVQPVASRYTD